MELTMMDIGTILEHPHFIGLWAYRHKNSGRQRLENRRFCASVLSEGLVVETSLRGTWEDALTEASTLLEG